MVFIKRAASAFAVLAVLALAAGYLPSPISTVAGIILGGFLLLFLLPLLLAVVGMVSVFTSDDGDGGWLDGIMDTWFMWSILDWLGFALKWPWVVTKWLFTRRWPASAKTRKQERTDEPPFNREA